MNIFGSDHFGYDNKKLCGYIEEVKEDKKLTYHSYPSVFSHGWEIKAFDDLKKKNPGCVFNYIEERDFHNPIFISKYPPNHVFTYIKYREVAKVASKSPEL